MKNTAGDLILLAPTFNRYGKINKAPYFRGCDHPGCLNYPTQQGRV